MNPTLFAVPRGMLANPGEYDMDISGLKPGDKVRTTDGAVAVVKQPTQDGRWILVRYTKVSDRPDLVGTEDLCDSDELVEILGDPDE